jgi:hydrogenase maturation factor HypF (carbamoyltransferase family)
MGKTHEKNGLPAFLNPPPPPERKVNLQVDKEKKCEHKYVHLDTIQDSTHENNAVAYRRTDLYFCEKCLEEKKVKKYDLVGYPYKSPDWF